MLATGPKLPPYIEETIYKRGIGAHGLAVRGLSTVKKLQSLRPFRNHLMLPADVSDLRLETIEGEGSNGLHPHGVIVIVLCAICALAVVPAILMLARKRRLSKRDSLIPIATKRDAATFRTLHRAIQERAVGRPAITAQHQPGRERVLKDIRLRLRRRRNKAVQLAPAGSVAYCDQERVRRPTHQSSPGVLHD